MNEPKDLKRNGLERLADAFVEDILSTPDEEILAEARQQGRDPVADAATSRAIFERAVKISGKARLDAARVAVRGGSRTRDAVIGRLDAVRARQELDRILRDHPETASKLTLAARNGKGISDEDVYGMLDDLAELGLISPGGDEEGGR